ncbi:SDR family oxidoreductase [Orrella sp. JC864]|uniref:SDR family oxidoreductase n=1 Tax=Orrella sp. JC864 TaxID=3120298 RepID=UPI00300B8ED5
MAARLQGKRALVTGAGQGIGRAIALAMVQEGASVLATSRSGAKLADLPSLDARIETAALDVTDEQAVARTVQAAGQIDVLVNCAGLVLNGTVLDCSLQDWRRSIDHNATGVFLMTRAALPVMLRRRGGAIVNVASVASSLAGVANRAAYGASKAAVIGLTKAVARDFIAQGLRCNALCPGTTDTPSLQERIQSSPDSERARREFIARQPMGRLGTVQEMAAAAVFLASDESAFMTGSVLVIDGGQTL